MKKKIWIIVFLPWFLIISVNACSTIHNEDVSSDVGRLECAQNGCLVQISPSPALYTALRLPEHDFEIQIYIESLINSEKVYLKRASNDRNGREYIAGLNEGFYLEWKKNNCTNMTKYYSFARVPTSRLHCDNTLNNVGNEVVTIQSAHSVSETICSYHLLPARFTNFSETLYLMAQSENKLHVIYNDDQSNELTDKIIILKNWTSVDFTTNYQASTRAWSRLKDGMTDHIVAVSTKRSCSCNDKSVRLDVGSSIELQSPGYPDFLCPSSSCESWISFIKPNASDEFLHRTLISITAHSRDAVSLSLESETLDIRLNKRSFSKLSTSFLVDDNDLKIVYKTLKLLSTGIGGHYKMVIKNIKIKKGCECSLFTQKGYQTDENFKIYIPSYCEILFCDWAIVPFKKEKREIKIKLENGHLDDEVHIWNKDFMEIYKSNQLEFPRKLYLSDATSEAYIFFWRKSLGSNATFSVSWNTVLTTSCQRLEHVLLTTAPTPFISSHYPVSYSSLGNCLTILEAPENHFVTVHITDFDVENFHDHLSFYDGNSSESTLIRHLTGKHNNLTLSSTGRNMTAEFIMDYHHYRRGYHFIAFSVLNPNQALSNLSGNNGNEEQTLFADLPTSEFNNTASSKNSQSAERYGILHFVFVIFLTALFTSIITAAVIFGILIIRKKVSNSNEPNSFSNAMVRFRSEDDDSIATVGN